MDTRSNPAGSETLTDLMELQASPPPRPEALCQRLARRFEPWWGFLLYGILYFAAVSSTLTLAAMFALGYLLTSVLKVGPLRGAWEILAFVWTLLAMAASWIPFAWWVRRRRGLYRKLVREGDLLEGRVVAVDQGHDRYGPYTRITVEVKLTRGSRRFGVRYPGHRQRPAVGDRDHLLQHPDVKHAAAFRDGRTEFGLLV